MPMKKFQLSKLLEKNSPESVAHVVEIAEAAGLDKSVEVVRHAITIEAESAKALPKFADEPKIEAGSGIFPLWVTTRDVDRDREIVMPRGINLKEWSKSGVIIQGHDYSTLPLGKAVWVGVSDYGIKMHIQGAPTEDGEKIVALSKFMPLTASIGMGAIKYAGKGSPEFEKITKRALKEWPEFTPKKAEELGGIIVESTLLEVSIVSVPANPNAVQTQLAKSALDCDDLTEREKGIVRKVFELGDEGGTHEGDEQGDRVKALESEVRDLKAKCEQLIAEKAEAEEKRRDTEKRLKAVCDEKRVERIPAVEIVEAKGAGESGVEVIGKSVSISHAVKNEIDLRRGMI